MSDIFNPKNYPSDFSEILESLRKMKVASDAAQKNRVYWRKGYTGSPYLSPVKPKKKKSSNQMTFWEES